MHCDGQFIPRVQQPEGVTVNEKERRWSVGDQSFTIGSGMVPFDSSYKGCVAVFNLANNDHLNMVINNAIEQQLKNKV